MSYQKLSLISHHLCPYVQRSVITLSEKQIPYERINVDLSDKPAWFSAISPLGKVPCLRVDDNAVLFESAVICEFLDEVTPGSLHPQDPLEKAQHRAWIEFGSQLLNDIAKLYNAKNDEALQDCCGQIQHKWQRLEQVVQGPFFAGDEFHLVDAVYGPIFRYFDTMEPHLPLDVFAECVRVAHWRQALAQRPSVQQAVSREYPVLLRDFLLRRESALSQRMLMRAA